MQTRKAQRADCGVAICDATWLTVRASCRAISFHKLVPVLISGVTDYLIAKFFPMNLFNGFVGYSVTGEDSSNWLAKVQRLRKVPVIDTIGTIQIARA